MFRFASLVSLASLVLITANSGAMSADPAITLVTLGDSYINGYSIGDPADRFSAKVAAELRAKGHTVVFQDVGFTNTSSDAAQWMKGVDALGRNHAGLFGGKALLADPANHALILEIGQNDCQSSKLEATKANINSILAALASEDIPVLVVGTKAYDFCGKDYAARFATMFSDLATKYGDLLYPDFKTGVEDQFDLLSADRDHPNKAGEAIVATNILSSVEALIARVSAH